MNTPDTRDNATVSGVSYNLSSTLWIALPPALLTAIVTLIGLGSRSLWLDEYATWCAASRPFAELHRLVDHTDAVIAPYYVAMHGWIAVAGDSAIAMRLPSVLAMSCSAGLVALIGRRLFDPAVGLCAGIAFALIPMVSRYGQEARPYALAMAGVTLATLLLLRAIEVPTWRRWLGYGAVVALSGAMHIVALTVLAAHLIPVVREAFVGRWRTPQRWATVVALALAALAPLAYEGSKQTAVISWIRADRGAVRHFPGKLFGTDLLAVFMIALACTAALVLWRHHRAVVAFVFVWAVLPPLFVYVTYPVVHLFLPRYVLFTLPAWVLLASALVGVVTRRFRPKSPNAFMAGAAALVLAIAVLGLPGQFRGRQDPTVGWPNYHRAAAIIESLRGPADGIIYTGEDDHARLAFAYEHAIGVIGVPRDVLVGRSAVQAASFTAGRCRDAQSCLSDPPVRIWMLCTGDCPVPIYTGVGAEAAEILKRDFSTVKVAKGEKFTIFRLDRRSSANS